MQNHQTAEWAITLQERVSQDAEHNGEIQNDVTFCFARQTGSDSILMPDNSVGLFSK